MPPPIMFIGPGTAGAAIVTYPANFIPGGGADPGAPTMAPAGTPGTVAADGIDAEKEGPPAPNHPPDGLREDQEPDADPKAPVPSVRLESESVEKETSELAEGTTLLTDELGEDKSDIDAAS